MPSPRDKVEFGAGKEVEMYAEMADVMVGVEVEQERKLLRIPGRMGTSVLRADVQRFEQERGCPVRKVLVARNRFVEVLRLVGLAGLTDLQVRADTDVRAGHIVLVGEL